MKKTKILILGVAALALLATPLLTKAISGINVDNVEVKVLIKQGGEWFKARTKKTDGHGVLTVKGALPGSYKLVIRDGDQGGVQVLAGKFKMLDNEGRRINHRTDVDVYTVANDGTKTFFATYVTDRSGWLELPAALPDTEYYLDVEEDSSLSSKDNRPRIKVKAKIDDSDWFQSNYDRLDENGVLRLKGVKSGKYKFKYKSKDVTNPAQPFILQAKLVKNNGKKIKEKTKVKLYVYVMKTRMKVAEMKTDVEGWITVPGVVPGMKYKIKVSD